MKFRNKRKIDHSFTTLLLGVGVITIISFVLLLLTLLGYKF